MSEQPNPDINQFFRDPRYRITVEPNEDPVEAIHRRELELSATKHAQWITKAVFVVLLIVAVILLLIILISENASTQDWGRNLFAGIVGLLAGFAGGTSMSSAK